MRGTVRVVSLERDNQSVSWGWQVISDRSILGAAMLSVNRLCCCTKITPVSLDWQVTWSSWTPLWWYGTLDSDTYKTSNLILQTEIWKRRILVDLWDILLHTDSVSGFQFCFVFIPSLIYIILLSSNFCVATTNNCEHC